jgi:hypothetical protein
MLKTLIKFALVVIASQIVTYFIAGVVAQTTLGANEFYPPSPNAIGYLKDPHTIPLASILGAQALRGLLFALVLYPFRLRILDLGTWTGGFAVSGIIFVMGYVAASGGMIEHFLFFKPEDYPVKFAVITFVEILIQTAIMGPAVVYLEKRFGGTAAPASA